MLENARIDLTVPVVDLARATKFYGGTLGLKQLDLPSPELCHLSVHPVMRVRCMSCPIMRM